MRMERMERTKRNECNSHHVRLYSTIYKHEMDIYVCRRILTIYVVCVCVRMCLHCAVSVNVEYTSYVCCVCTVCSARILICLCNVKKSEIEICAFFLVKALFTRFRTHKCASSSYTWIRMYVCV